MLWFRIRVGMNKVFSHWFSKLWKILAQHLLYHIAKKCCYFLNAWYTNTYTVYHTDDDNLVQAMKVIYVLKHTMLVKNHQKKNWLK